MIHRHTSLRKPASLWAPLLLLLLTSPLTHSSELPEGFDYAEKHIPGLVTDLKYFSTDNFVGQPIESYHANRAILTLQVIKALAEVQSELNLFGLGIKIYDA